MSLKPIQSYESFSKYYCAPEGCPVTLDYSLTGVDGNFLKKMDKSIQGAFAAMKALEGGAIANPDENRMVGHYWLRNTDLIPDADLKKEVESDLKEVFSTIKKIHDKNAIDNVLTIGIGGSALGPQLVADALGKDDADKMTPYFLDNTDPEGVERTLNQLKHELKSTVVLVISKSGGTPETRNGMLLAEEFWKKAGLNFEDHAIAITGRGSKLDKHAEANNWMARLPMYDWVGGRTSVMSAVGLVPAGLQGIDIQEFLDGAKKMDEYTRSEDVKENPAALLALYWYHATNGKGEKDMVVIPYKDRLLLFSKYLQQLVMESLGKEHDLDGNVVEQGITVYGNKGSTDQHAYVQQLRDGVNNFFMVFIEVLKDGGSSLQVEENVSPGDYLSGFYQGTRRALAEKGRVSATITIDEVTPTTLGALIALFERAVGLYASLVNINAYHQPGVEAGKKAAASILELQKTLLEALANSKGEKKSAEEWAKVVSSDPESVFKILQHLSANNRGVKMTGGRTPTTAVFSG